MRDVWRCELLAASLGGLAVFVWMPEAAPVVPALRAEDAAEPVAAALPSSTVSRATVGTIVPSETPKFASTAAMPSLEAWGAAFSSQQPVAEVLRLRSARKPGSFAISSELAIQCGGAMYMASKAWGGTGYVRISELDAAKSPHYAERLRARAKIQTRCQAIEQYDGLLKPLPDDPDGIAWERAIAQRTDLRPASQRHVAQELTRQGSFHMAIAIPVYTNWNGQTLDPALYLGAYHLAGLLATAAPGGGAEDIRLLTGCVEYGRCTDNYLEFWRMGSESVDPKLREKIEAIAQQMAAAMRAGDYGKFVP